VAAVRSRRASSSCVFLFDLSTASTYRCRLHFLLVFFC